MHIARHVMWAPARRRSRDGQTILTFFFSFFCVVKNVVVLAGRGESLALWADDDNHLGCNNKKNKKEEEGTGTPVGRKQLERFSSFRKKKKGKVLHDILQGFLSFLFVILRRLSRWPVVVRSSFLFGGLSIPFFFLVSAQGSPHPICVCVRVKMFSVKNETQSKGSH